MDSWIQQIKVLIKLEGVQNPDNDNLECQKPETKIPIVQNTDHLKYRQNKIILSYFIKV